MTLRRRIAAGTALACAVAVLAIGGAAYLIVRSHMRGEIDSALVARTAPLLQPHPADHGHGGPGGGPGDGGGHGFPTVTPERFGGANGVMQIIQPDGSTHPIGGPGLQPPVSAAAIAVANGRHNRYFADETVAGQHLRVYVVHDAYDGYAVMAARPLTEVDRVLHDLLLPFALAIGGAILLAATLGTLIARGALAPITRFTRRTERITGALDRTQRIEEKGVPELARLAASFNRTLDALEHSVVAQRHLVADASHELRTPIAALRTNIQIFLEAERLPRHERDEMRVAIIAELDELTQLVADVVELARGAEPSAQIERLRLDELVAEAVARTRRRAPELELDVELEPTLIENAADRVGRAVTNVLDNARKWSPADAGAVEVRLADGVLSVRDRGPGFDEADLPHVFDRFYRAAAARRMPGSGLGLAIVRQAAESRGGFATAANAPDGGAIVRISFGPVLDPGERADYASAGRSG